MAEQKKKRGAGKPKSKTAQYERALADGGGERYVLRLYVSGATPNSQRAIHNIKQLCENRLKNRYALEIIDVYQQPGMVARDEIVAAPTLVKDLPLPVRRLTGDFSDEEHVLIALDLLRR